MASLAPPGAVPAEEANAPKTVSQQLMRAMRCDPSSTPDAAALSRIVDDLLLSPAAAARDKLAAAFLSDEPLCAALCWRFYAGVGRAHADRAAPGGAEDAVCRWLFGWYASGAQAPRAFVLRVVPAVVWAVSYCAVAYEGAPPGAEAVLLCVHNAAAKEHGAARDMLLPSLAASPAPGAQSQLTESALGQLEIRAPRRVTVGTQIEPKDCIREAERAEVLRVVLSECNDVLTTQPIAARLLYCRVASRMASLGHPFDTCALERFPGVTPEHQALLRVPEPTQAMIRRVQMPAPLLCEALRGLGLCLYRKETRPAAEEAVASIERNALYMGSSTALIAARSLQNIAAKWNSDAAAVLPTTLSPVLPTKPLVYVVSERKPSGAAASPRASVTVGSTTASGAVPNPDASVSSSDGESESESSDESSSDDD
eukprot:m51a1_g2420 hypothetical protein (427) ;mRNA; f:807854-809283